MSEDNTFFAIGGMMFDIQDKNRRLRAQISKAREALLAGIPDEAYKDLRLMDGKSCILAAIKALDEGIEG